MSYLDVGMTVDTPSKGTIPGMGCHRRAATRQAKMTSQQKMKLNKKLEVFNEIYKGDIDDDPELISHLIQLSDEDRVDIQDTGIQDPNSFDTNSFHGNIWINKENEDGERE